MDILLSFFLGQTWWIGGVFALAIILYSVLQYRQIATNDAMRGVWLARLRLNSYRRTYRKRMTQVLDWLDQRLSKSEIHAGRGPYARIWSQGLLNITILLALAYPILSLSGQWLAGFAIRFNGEIILPAGSDPARIYVVYWLAITFTFLFLFISFRNLKSLCRSAFLIAALMAFFCGAFLATKFDVPTIVIFITVFAIIFAVIVAFAGASDFVSTKPRSRTTYSAGTTLLTGTLAATFALAVSNLAAFAFALAGAIASIAILAFVKKNGLGASRP